MMDRRRFLIAAIVAIGAGIAAALGVPAVAYVLGPATTPAPPRWLRLGSTRSVEVGRPTLFKTSVDRTVGWVTEQVDLSFYVKTDDGRDYEALSNICTHLACRVRWVEDRRAFYCPCHAGVFDEDGNVVSGPPPRPLDRYEVKAENGELLLLLPGD